MMKPVNESQSFQKTLARRRTAVVKLIMEEALENTHTAPSIEKFTTFDEEMRKTEKQISHQDSLCVLENGEQGDQVCLAQGQRMRAGFEKDLKEVKAV